MKSARGRDREVIGAVLAGGASRRMGRDKALLVWKGRTLLERAIEALAPCVDEVVVIGPGRGGYGDSGLPVIADLRPGLGPLGGIHTALVHGAGRDVFVLACDLPEVESGLIRWILQYRVPERDQGSATVIGDCDGPQPLCGLYSAGCLPMVEQALDRGALSARELVESVDSVILDLTRAPNGIRRARLRNLNTPGEVAAWAGSRESIV